MGLSELDFTGSLWFLCRFSFEMLLLLSSKSPRFLKKLENLQTIEVLVELLGV